MALSLSAKSHYISESLITEDAMATNDASVFGCDLEIFENVSNMSLSKSRSHSYSSGTAESDSFALEPELDDCMPEFYLTALQQLCAKEIAPVESLPLFEPVPSPCVDRNLWIASPSPQNGEFEIPRFKPNQTTKSNPLLVVAEQKLARTHCETIQMCGCDSCSYTEIIKGAETWSTPMNDARVFRIEILKRPMDIEIGVKYGDKLHYYGDQKCIYNETRKVRKEFDWKHKLTVMTVETFSDGKIEVAFHGNTGKKFLKRIRVTPNSNVTIFIRQRGYGIYRMNLGH